MRRAAAAVVVTTSLVLGAPGIASAQAVCSAPHSAPMVAASGSILVLEPGQGWLQLALRGVRSTQFYGAGGSVHDLPGVTSATTLSTYLTAAVGLARGVELWAQVPVHRLRVVDVAQTRERVGLGDPRVSVRLGSQLLGLPPYPVSVRAGVKVAGSDFPVDARVLPLTEGQTDYEVAAEAGTTLSDGAAYVVAWAGYRWRTLDASTGREPGDERFAHFALGGAVAGLRAELGLDVLDGLTPIQNRVPVPASARRLVQLSPVVGWAAGSGRVEVGAQIPVSGRNLPTGPAFTVGYLLGWGGT